MEPVVSTVVPVCITLFAGLAIYCYFGKNKRRVPKKWEPVGTVTKLFLYPLKGGRRVELEHAVCTKRGLVMPNNESKYQFKDRNIICYKEKNLEYCSYPKMQLVEVSASDENHFILSAPDTPSLRVKIPNAVQDKNNKGEVIFWNKENISKYDCGDDASKWISLFVTGSESGLRLGFFDDNFHRDIQDSYKKCLKLYPNLKNEAAGLFTNLSSYMIVNQASVDDISGKLPDENITANNFRPNILVQDKDLLAFAEDHWNMIIVNPETGVESANKEPMKTLRKYRKLRDVLNIAYEGYSVVFGNHMGLEHEGHIRLGDTVFVGQ